MVIIKEKKLLKNTLILLLGTFLPQFAGLVTMPVYTGMLTKLEYGTYDIINASIYILIVFSTFQIHLGVFRYLIEVRKTKMEDSYISTTFYFTFIIGTIIAAMFPLLFQSHAVIERFLIGLFLFLNIQYSVFGQICRGLGNTKTYSIAAIINAFLNMLLVVLFLVGFEKGFLGLLISVNLAILVTIIYMTVSCRLYEKIKYQLVEKSILVELFNYSWPMVPNTLSVWIINSVDKYIITLALGLELNAIYAISVKVTNIYNVVFAAFNLSWQEVASESFNSKERNKFYSNMFQALIKFLTGSILILMATTPYMFNILIRGNYIESYYQIPILYFGAFFSSFSSFYDGIYIASKRTKSIGVSSVIGAVFNAATNLMLINYFGLWAASTSTVLSFLVLAVYKGTELYRSNVAKIKYRLLSILSNIFLICISITLFYAGYNLINVIYAVIGFLILNFTLIKILAKKLKDKIDNFRFMRNKK